MYCPNCGKEISEQAAFCGYCGATLARFKPEPKPKFQPPPPPPQEVPPVPEQAPQAEEISPPPKMPVPEREPQTEKALEAPAPEAAPPVPEQAPQAEEISSPPKPPVPEREPQTEKAPEAPAPEAAPPVPETGPQAEEGSAPPPPQPPQERERAAPPPAGEEPPKGKGKKKKKRTGLKLFVVCCLLAMAAGGAMGFLTARGTIDWRSYLPLEQFLWTAPTEGETRTDSQSQPEEEEEEKESASSGASSQDSSSQGENTQDGVPGTGENVQGTQPPGEESHYAMYRSSVLLVVDDQAKVMDQVAIEAVLDRAKEAASASGYSILLVLTGDLQGKTMEAFASEYYTRALEGTELKEDGFLFLVDVTGGESFLWTSGEAQMPEDVTGEVQANLAAGEYKTALLNVLERVPS